MILTGHQPVYLPWLGLFHKIAIADKFIFLDTVQYLKKDWNNRNNIKTANGVSWLTVPILTKNKFNQNLYDTKINNHKNGFKRKMKMGNIKGKEILEIWNNKKFITMREKMVKMQYKDLKLCATCKMLFPE